MKFTTFTCPNCGANYNPAKYQCAYCGSYIFMSNDNYADFSNVKIEFPQEDTDKYPGVYVFGRLLGLGERPLTLGAANYYTGITTAGGKLLLTNKSLSFSAHGFNVGRQEVRIDLKSISRVESGANFLISQQIIVYANGQKHKFVVYHGSEWVQKIKEAMAQSNKSQVNSQQGGNYIEELRQLKQLLDMGVITEEEFNIKKRMLLGF